MEKWFPTKLRLILLASSVLFLFLFIYWFNGGKLPNQTTDIEHEFHSVSSVRPMADSPAANGVKVGRTGKRKESDLVEKYRDLGSRNLTHQEMRAERQRLIESIAEEFGFDVAYSLITEELGKGTEKEFLVASIFSVLREDIGVSLERLNALDEGERDFAIAGLCGRINAQKLPDAAIVEFISNQSVVASRGALRMALLTDLANANDSVAEGEMLRRWTRIIGECKMSGGRDLIVAIVDGASKIRPFVAWEFIAESGWLSHDSSNRDAQERPVIDKIVRQMAITDPNAAMDMLLRSGDAGKNYLSSEIQIWMKLSLNAAKKWISENESKFSRQQMDSVLTGVAKYCASSGEFVEARSALDSVVDSQLREQIAGQVWTAERDALRKEVSRDPAGALQSIIEEKSKYTDYWLEEAMGTWISKDFDKAQSWYQDNWNKLPANKAQFLAAAFANQATGQGDTATARQWAAHIQDPKTKQRIEAGIAKAEASKHN